MRGQLALPPRFPLAQQHHSLRNLYITTNKKLTIQSRFYQELLRQEINRITEMISWPNLRLRNRIYIIPVSYTNGRWRRHRHPGNRCVGYRGPWRGTMFGSKRYCSVCRRRKIELRHLKLHPFPKDPQRWVLSERALNMPCWRQNGHLALFLMRYGVECDLHSHCLARVLQAGAFWPPVQGAGNMAGSEDAIDFHSAGI